MLTAIHRERLQRIHTILVEFASGNFLFKLERTEMEDEIEALVVLINMTLEEIKDSFLHQGYVNLQETYKQFIQLFFVLNMEDTIIAFNSRIQQLLFIEDKKQQENAFSYFLTQDSKLKWKNFKSKITTTKQNKIDEFLTLSFKTNQHLILTTNCLIGTFLDKISQQQRLIVTSIEIIKDSKERELALLKAINLGTKKNKVQKETPHSSLSTKRANLGASDIRKIRGVHDHIMNNLGKPLSPLIELAHSFGTNEYKLKYGFKKLYGQTVFRFLLHERLRKASILIQHTDIQLKEVAYITGFKSVPHFSKAFKEKYGYTARDLRKQSHNDRL